jgi:molybdopterin synthase sulfur carrier subunit
MKIKIRAFGDLMPLLGKESVVELETHAKLKDLISKLAKVSNSEKGYTGSYNMGEENLVILLNGRNIHALKKLETPLKDGDVVTIFPPLVGG